MHDEIEIAADTFTVAHSRPVLPPPDDILIVVNIAQPVLRCATDNFVSLGYLDWSIICASGGTAIIARSTYTHELRDARIYLAHSSYEARNNIFA